MSYGFQIYNSSNAFIVDGEQPNYCAYVKGTVSPQLDPDAIGMWGYLMPHTLEGMYVIRPDYGLLIGLMDYYTDNFSGTAVYDRNFIMLAAYPNTNLLKYAYLKSFADIPAASTGFGVQIFGLSGQSVYNSEQSMFFIDTVMTLQQTAVMADVTTTFTLPTPEFGQRYIQVVIVGSTGAYGADAGIYITLNSETSITVTLRALPENSWGASMPFTYIVKICTGYLA